MTKRFWLLISACLPALAGSLPLSVPLSFEPNLGQTDAPVKFLARAPGYTLLVTPREAVFAGRDGSVERMQFAGTNPNPRIEGLDRLPGISNYFIGNDQTKWRTNIPNYARFELRDIYPGIDLVFYGKDGRLEYDWVIAPGADPKQIRVRWQTPGQITETTDGDLILSVSLTQKKPVIMQNGKRVAGGYRLHGNQVRFEIAGYDSSKPLTIDPVVLAYSTYLDGSTPDPNLSQAENGLGIAADSAGNIYVTGKSVTLNFPTADPIQAIYKGGADAFVTKLNPAGSALVYSTYLGGSNFDMAWALALDSSGDVYITGGTTSSDFPLVNPIQSVNRSVSGGNNNPLRGLITQGTGFVAEIDAAGSALVYSTYLGGSGADFGLGIKADSSGNAYVGGFTSSPDFPAINALQGTLRSPAGNGFVTELRAGGSPLVYSTFLGGTGQNGNGDTIIALAVDSVGAAYVTGYTSSTNFPTQSPLQATLNSAANAASNAFVSKINPAGVGLAYSTYLGGTGSDVGNGIAVDSAGNAYVTGFTYSKNFPIANALQPNNSDLVSGKNAFITKINAAGSALVYSTYLGGSGTGTGEVGTAIAVDGAGDVYVVGNTDSTNFPLANSVQNKYGGSTDGFVTELNPAGSALVYSTYLGGSGNDTLLGVAVDSADSAHVTGFSYSSDFPTTTNALQKSSPLGTSGSVVVAKITQGSAAEGTLPAAVAILSGNNQTGTVQTQLAQPLTVQVTNSAGSGVAGVTVTFMVTSGMATLSADSVETNASGTAGITLILGAAVGTITVEAAIAGSSIPTVQFAESVTNNSACPIGAPSITSVNSATDFGAFSDFASGSYLEVKGTNLAIDSRQWASSDFSGFSAPTSLDGSKVSIDGLPGYVSYISGQQINVQAPADPATGMMPIAVTNCGGTSNKFLFQKNALAPGMLAPSSFNVGKQYLVALFASDLSQGMVTYVGNTGLITGANFRPAKPGDVIIIFGLGFGAVSPATSPGVIASGATSLTGLSISFGSTPVSDIAYAGLYPDFVGLYEFYLTVPNAASGDSPINISIDGTSVPQTFYLTLQ